MFEKHLPYFWYPCSACFTCKEQLWSFPHLKKMHLDVHPADAYQFRELRDYVGRVLSSLHKLSWKLTQRTELTSLLKFVVDKQLYPEYDSQRTDFTPTELLLMVPFQKIWEEENVEPQVSPPSGLTSLLHWRIIVNLVLKLPKERQALFKNGSETEAIPTMRTPILWMHISISTC